MWCPLTVHRGCFLLALTSQASKDSFSTGTNFSLWIINCIQTLRAVWATCARGPREDHAVEKRTVEEKKKREEERDGEKNLIERQDVLFGVVQCSWIPQQTPIQMVQSSFLLCQLFASLSSKLFI